MSKLAVILVVALCALVAAVSAVPFPLPVGAPAPKESLKGAEQVYYAGYGVPYGGYAAYAYPGAYAYYG